MRTKYPGFATGLLAFLLCLQWTTVLAQFSLLQFQKLGLITGSWQKPQRKGMLYEIWEQQGDSLLKGRSFSVRGKDTIPEESVVIAWHDQSITYTATVFRQNGGLPVSFVLRNISDSGFLFENPGHDFPQRVRYRPAGDSLFASISGSTVNGFNSVSFPYSRVGGTVGIHPMEYFSGSWQVRVWMQGNTDKSKPDIKAKWVVEKPLDKAFCLLGHVDMDNERNHTAEMITFDPFSGLFVRTIAGNDGSYYRFTTYGWKGERLTWTGEQSIGENLSLAMKEEIVMISQDLFRAVYYVKRSGEWTGIMSEELERIKH